MLAKRQPDTLGVALSSKKFGRADHPARDSDRWALTNDRSASTWLLASVTMTARPAASPPSGATSCSRGTMPAAANVSSALRSAQSSSSSPGGVPSNTVMTHSAQASPRTSQRSQSTIMSVPVSTGMSSQPTLRRGTDNSAQFRTGSTTPKPDAPGFSSGSARPTAPRRAPDTHHSDVSTQPRPGRR